MTRRRERKLLRRQVNHLRDLHRDVRQRVIGLIAVAMATALAGNALAHDKASWFLYVMVVVLGTLTVIVGLAVAGSYYFYRRARTEHEGQRS